MNFDAHVASVNVHVVKPSFEFMYTNTENNYLEFIERCIRTCYKSEDHIKEGSAEKLINKVVNKFGHHSTIEHGNAIFYLPLKMSEFDDFMLEIIECVPLFAYRTSFDSRCIISGNFRMWRRLFRKYSSEYAFNDIINAIKFKLANEYPIFFNDISYNTDKLYNSVLLLDNDPKTNENKLSEYEMKTHMTLTGKFIGSRNMSHQLVRHRIAAYSQESQRYCNYGNKGLQIIIPPTFKKYEDEFINDVKFAYSKYLSYLDNGIPPEDARFILPSIKTEVVTTYTLGMWQHVIEHRAHNKKAQWEIRELCLDAEREINNYIGWEVCSAKFEI